MGAQFRSIRTCIILLAFAMVMPTSKCLMEGPEPNTTDATVLPVPTPLPIHPTLEHLSPRPGEPGSPENPGTIIPGPSQAWFASVYYRGLIPAERLRRRNQLCNRKTICEEGTCCQQTSRSRRRCKPLGKLGDPCSPRSLSNVYFGMCPCGVNQEHLIHRGSHKLESSIRNQSICARFKAQAFEPQIIGVSFISYRLSAFNILNYLAI
ncbi:uncharacterized protein LOC119168044 isoform X1 [Rhipicephalus microplus]|uniref:uncharacterized protein LOC119168044 isoform X1 n=1 Tax=Rhipicephalus microplus TaxID=6941 RepID=UPI003F6B6C06